MGPLLPAIPEKVFNGHEYWRLFTAILAHADLEHFLANSLPFAVLCYLLYGYFGFWIYPVLTLALGALVNAISLTTYGAHDRLLGASGVVYLMAAFWVTLYLFVDRRYSPAQRGMRSLGFTLAFLAPSSIEPRVSYRTHAIGFAVGILFALFYYAFRWRALRAAEIVEYE